MHERLKPPRLHAAAIG